MNRRHQRCAVPSATLMTEDARQPLKQQIGLQ